jgi:hypothetical protein
MAHFPVSSHSTGTPVANDQAFTTIFRGRVTPRSVLLIVNRDTPMSSASSG